MESIFWDALLTFIPLALIALVSVKFSRPFFEAPWAIVVSQTIAVLLLFIAHSIAQGLSGDRDIASADARFLWGVAITFFGLKSIAIYLIACYCKSRDKNPYWCFVGALNFLIALPILVFGVWMGRRQSAMPRSEMIKKLAAMIDDPDTPEDRRKWASDRLQKLDKQQA